MPTTPKTSIDSAVAMDYRVAQARLFIDADPAKPWSSRDLARECALSPGEFSRKFNRDVRCSFSEYLTQRRILCAKHLLSTSRLSVKEVAATCGFCDKSHFVKAFRAIELTTPQRYRIAQLCGGKEQPKVKRNNIQQQTKL